MAFTCVFSRYSDVLVLWEFLTSLVESYNKLVNKYIGNMTCTHFRSVNSVDFMSCKHIYFNKQSSVHFDISLFIFFKISVLIIKISLIIFSSSVPPVPPRRSTALRGATSSAGRRHHGALHGAGTCRPGHRCSTVPEVGITCLTMCIKEAMPIYTRVYWYGYILFFGNVYRYQYLIKIWQHSKIRKSPDIQPISIQAVRSGRTSRK